MPITTEIKFRTSTTAGSAGFSNAQTTPGQNLGKYMATTEQSATTELVPVFPPVTGDESTAGNVDYQCVFIHNTHATLTLLSPKLWITGQQAGGATAAIGLDPAAASAQDSATAQAAQIASKQSAPTDVTFTTPTDKASGLSVGDLAPGQCRAFWVRRTTTAGAGALAGDNVLWRCEGDTEA